MISKWFGLREEAVNLRLKGNSIKEIEKRLKIPRSTLSGWLREVKLNDKQLRKLLNNQEIGLIKARKLAAIWHREQKKLRLAEAREQAVKVLSKVETQDRHILELSLAMLYLGEGDKTRETAIGNANPTLIIFFIKSLNILYGIDKLDLKYELHLRNDQNEAKLKQIWSRKLRIPVNYFKVYKDKRTVKSKSYKTYLGVCVVRAGNIALQRKIMQIGQEFCKIVTSA